MDFLKIGLKDLLDILIVWALFYQVLKLFRGTRTAYIIFGLTGLAVVALLAQFLNLEALNSIIQGVETVGVLALIIIFQPEIRRVLANLGRTPWLRQLLQEPHPGLSTIHEVAHASFQLRTMGLGALIVLERQVELDDLIEESGVRLDAKVTAPLLVSIFLKTSPLHDGAVIIRQNRVVAARVILPLYSGTHPLPEEFGTRHKAAMGVMEHSDAVVIVVSEERNEVRLGHDLLLERVDTEVDLIQKLKALLIPEPEEAEESLAA